MEMNKGWEELLIKKVSADKHNCVEFYDQEF